MSKVVFFAMQDGAPDQEWATMLKEALTEKFGEDALLVFATQCNGITVVDAPDG